MALAGKWTLGGTAFDLLGLFLPRVCSACERPLMRNEDALCLHCLTDLPRNRYHEDPDNRVELVFRGRVQLEAASAFLRFDSGGRVQHMLHRLKYRNDSAIGIQLGRLMGEELSASYRFSTVDTLMVVPLHPKKEKARGYNQCQMIADGLRMTWPLEQAHSTLLRQVSTPSQTRRGRLERWNNVSSAFAMSRAEELTGRHILLLDDVVTTGATLEACARVLRQVQGVRISICTLACA